ncbi:hypothetical protein GUITHDRAFT_139624 [Guillardia theta CCMP2712]|uniref:SAP domain-containing protein n=1 Tax=Guillardia theta (strain CCMP2712) TaxID=905079 RepID=L1J9F4_GUITC|nr:hypothetical protein GUITHDRAFT_139624 [Guillardia theta CCMP2712]EKX44700.1 hypothetical protein GUITHDRAFT_139624 [Guillardia theta CCMP2712]|eukprot:XP_005831680.1 hypothetical protein GUITHDRAFT_139624 [Guillardia theta CCMP2712]
MAAPARVVGACLAWASSRGLPSQLSCHRSCEAALSSMKKEELRALCSSLGLNHDGSTAQLILSVVETIVARRVPLPPEYPSLNYVSSLSAHSVDVLPSLRCWKCGASVEPCVKNIADFQVGSWPPGDSRRWQNCESVVIPSLICHAECAREELEEAGRRGETARPPSNQQSTRRRSCRVGDFATIVGLRWEERWIGLQEILMLERGGSLADGLIDVPTGPCIERVALQLLNWFSMSCESWGEKSYLPARVYLTRRTKLCCRGGSIVGFMTFTDSPDKHFVLPSLNAIFVLPGARRKGACREMVQDFVRGVEERERGSNRARREGEGGREGGEGEGEGEGDWKGDKDSGDSASNLRKLMGIEVRRVCVFACMLVDGDEGPGIAEAPPCPSPHPLSCHPQEGDNSLLLLPAS